MVGMARQAPAVGERSARPIRLGEDRRAPGAGPCWAMARPGSMDLSTNPVHSRVHFSPSGVRKAIAGYLAAGYRPITAAGCDRSGVASRERGGGMWVEPLTQLIPGVPLLDDESVGVESQDRCAG